MSWIYSGERMVTEANVSDWEKTMVVTGATSGIGLAAAGQLARAGVTVIGVGRSEERCRAAEEHLRSLHPAGRAHFVRADLTLQRDVHAAAEEIRRILAGLSAAHLDGLLNNAGGFSFWLTLTAEGFEQQWALHHLAPFLLTNELLPLLQAAPAARVVTVSSGSHYGARMKWNDLQLRRRYNGLTAYGQSKLANVLFTLELNRRLGADSPVSAFAADPGLVKTDIGRKGTPGFVGWIWQVRQSGGIPAEESAKGIVRLLLDAAAQPARGIYWRHGEPVQPDRRGLDVQAARRLWAVSEQMCGMAAKG